MQEPPHIGRLVLLRNLVPNYYKGKVAGFCLAPPKKYQEFGNTTAFLITFWRNME